MTMIPQEISMLISSDPSMGAINRTQDGSSFEVNLQDGLRLPADAVNINISVEESTVWWVIPNIITNVNDKMYVTGNEAGTALTKTQLGYPNTTVFSMTASLIVPNISTLTISNIAGGIPNNLFIVGDIFRPDAGVSIDLLYTIVSIGTITPNTSYTYTVSGLLEGNIVSSLDSFTRIRTNGLIKSVVITIPQGLYDLSGLNQSINRELALQGMQTDPDPCITLTPDTATQKVQISFNYTTVSVDFTQPNTFRSILGFDSLVYGPYVNAPVQILAPFIASFNQVNYFLIHSDLTNKGIRFNNNYNQTIAQVLINVPPGSQIVSTPFNPARISASELGGANRTNLRFWLTDDKDRPVNTNSEYWTARIVIKYFTIVK
jgi:hypothetical protein